MTSRTIKSFSFLLMAGVGLLGITLLAASSASAQTTISTDGVIESKAGGFKFPDGSVQATAEIAGPQGEQGEQGIQGIQGFKGDKGDTGNDGTNGTNGTDGTNGTNGTDGANGLNCWDLNGNGVNDPAEDVNGDTFFNTLDCQGPQGDAGADGADASLPPGIDPGDLLYWDGFGWLLTPAPPVGGETPPVLTLIAGVPTWVSTAVTYAIGDMGPAGGIVFHVTALGLHGLEAAPVDQSTGVDWGCDATVIPGADGTDIGTGKQNTVDILAGCATAGIAARLADNYSHNGFSDWFLPSKDELNELFLQKDVVGGFADSSYWSSSEESAFLSAWAQDFDGGSQNAQFKTTTDRVRAIRAF